MALTLEDLDRRVTALEQAADSEKNIVRAVSEIVSESEKRIRVEVSGSEKRIRVEMSELEKHTRADMSELRAEMKAEMQRLTDRVSASERRMIDTLNDRFDAVMAALDRPQNP